MKGLLRWVKRLTIGVVLLIVALAAAGGIWQSVASAADRRNFSPPGQLVDVGGHRLHLNCTGSGQPTVLLETGAMSMSSTWGWIQPEVAQRTRVCAYDRAGLGWSDPSPAPRDAVNIAGELHALLQAAAVTPPYVLVGYSYGGLLIRMYASSYPNEVTGLVFMDSSHPDQTARIEAVMGKQSTLALELLFSPALARLGATRLLVRVAPIMSEFMDLPQPQARQTAAFLSNPAHLTAGMAEMRTWDPTTAQVRATGTFGDLPIVVVNSTEGLPPIILPVQGEMNRELAALSTRGTMRIVAGATHVSLSARREHALQVAEAIRELVALSRGRRAGN